MSYLFMPFHPFIMLGMKVLLPANQPHTLKDRLTRHPHNLPRRVQRPQLVGVLGDALSHLRPSLELRTREPRKRRVLAAEHVPRVAVGQRVEGVTRPTHTRTNQVPAIPIDVGHTSRSPSRISRQVWQASYAS